MKDVFPLQPRTQYDSRMKNIFFSRNVKSFRFGTTESLSYLGPTIWELIPSDIKSLESLAA